LRERGARVTFGLPWERYRELRGLVDRLREQKYGQRRRGPEVSLSLLSYAAFVEGLPALREMSLEDLDRWCRSHRVNVRR